MSVWDVGLSSQVPVPDYVPPATTANSGASGQVDGWGGFLNLNGSSVFPPGDNTLLMARLGPDGYSQWIVDNYSPAVPPTSTSGPIGSTTPRPPPANTTPTSLSSIAFRPIAPITQRAPIKELLPSQVGLPLGTTANGSVSGTIGVPGVGTIGVNPNGQVSGVFGGPSGTIGLNSNGSVFGSLPGVGSVGIGSDGTLSGTVGVPGVGSVSLSPNGAVSGIIRGPLGSGSFSTSGNLSISAGAKASMNVKADLRNVISNTLRAGKPLNSSSVSSSMGKPDPTWTLNDAPEMLIPFRSTGISLTGPHNEPNVLTKASSLSAALNRGDPVLSYEWVALIVDPANPMTIEPIYIESLQAPTISFDQKMRFADGANLAYAGAMSVGQMSITLMADAYGKAFKLANNWIFSIYDQESGGFYAPSDYKKSVKLFIHDAKKGVIVQFDFLGVWPVSWNGHTWGQNSDPAPVQLSLSVDRVRVSGSAYWTDL
jgi:hypothetical protein